MTNEVGRDYWAGAHARPLTPDEADVATYASLLEGSKTRLLLGNTRALMPLCTAALDLEPFLEDVRVRTGDWTKNSEYFDAIFGDGVLNFTAELTAELLQMAGKHCKIFIVRSFDHHLPIMRIADYFGQPEDFEIEPSEVIRCDDYNFFIWRF